MLGVYPALVLTERLELRAIDDPVDLEPLYAILSHPASWEHHPERRHTDPDMTRRYIARAAARWRSDGLSYWTARRRADGVVVGLGGAQRHRSGSWNLNYRIAVAHRRRGYAVELARAALIAAASIDPDVAAIAWVDAHNAASRAVAERLGLHNCGLRVDADDGRERLAYADRPLPASD